MSAVTWIDKITICELINISSYCFFHDKNLILSIELSVLTWEILSWNTICTKMNFLILKARQLKHKSSDIEKTALHLW